MPGDTTTMATLDRTSNPTPPPTADATMHSIIQRVYGSVPEDVLDHVEVPLPTIADDEVLVRVRAASVDRGTWHVMSGLPYAIRLAGFGVRRPKGPNPGRSVAGSVVSVGKLVTALEPGDDVYGVCDGGAFAEYAAADAAKLARKPANLTWQQAAAVPISGLTALQAVRDKARVRAGQKVLVVGASGGVGTFAVQLAKAFGAEVTGVCSTAKVQLVASLGADDVIDYTRVDFADKTRRWDTILDIGGNRPLGHLRRALAPRGRLVIVGGQTDGKLLGGSDRQVRALLLSPFVGQTLGTLLSSENAADLDALRELSEAGALAPVVDRTYSLAETAAAVRYLLDGRAGGKVVIAV